MNSRIAFLDNLRTAITFTVIAFHVSVTFMAYSPEWWYVRNGQQSELLTLLVLLLDAFMMPVMFFISGYFAAHSRDRYPGRAFLHGKLRHIVIPWVTGTFLLAPAITYTSLLSRGTATGYPRFLSDLFFRYYYSQAHLWFLGVLFAFYGLHALTTPLQQKLATLPRSLMAFLVIGVSTLGMLSAQRFFLRDAWFSGDYLFVFQPTRLLGYLAFFYYGTYAHDRRWFESDPKRSYAVPFTVGVVSSGLIYVALRVTPTPPTIPSLVFSAVAHDAFCLCSLMLLLTVFRQKLYRETSVSKHLGRLSYAIYYVHQLPLVYLALFVVTVSLPLAAKWVLLFAGTSLLSVVGAMFLRRLPIVKALF
jgi:peptidoglycan/LPS O-acetylase OafA/YrhL